MTSKLMTVVLVLGLTLASASSWDIGDLRLIGANGDLVGVGDFDDDDYDLTLKRGYQGLVTAVGEYGRFEGMVNPDGSITLFSETATNNLTNDLERRGIDLELYYVDSFGNVDDDDDYDDRGDDDDHDNDDYDYDDYDDYSDEDRDDDWDYDDGYDDDDHDGSYDDDDRDNDDDDDDDWDDDDYNDYDDDYDD